MFRAQGPYPNVENVVTLWDVIWLAILLVETLVKVYDYFEKVSNFFSVFCVFLNKEWSVWHYIYIYVNLSKRATTFVKRAKQVVVFPLPWEFWPKREIGDIFVENAVLFLNVVTKCHYLSSFLRYMPNRLWEPFTRTRKIVIIWAKLARKSQTKKYIKNKNSAHSCHDIAVAVLRVQGPSQI